MMTKLSVLSILAAAVVLAAPKADKDKKVPQDLRDKSPNEKVRVIVRWRHGAPASAALKITGHGGKKVADLPLIDAEVYDIEAWAAIAAADDDDVVSVHPNRSLAGTAFSGGPDYGWQTAINNPLLSSLPYDGKGVGIALLDSGVDDHEDLKDSSGHSRILYKQSFVAGDTSVNDAFGHGHHIAGLLIGNGKKSTGGKFDYTIRALANNANLVSLRVLDKNGASDDMTVIAGIARAIQLKSTYNIRVMNLSLGRPVLESAATDPLCVAVQRAWEAGIVVVVAAGNGGRDNSVGNNGYGTINAPGNSPYVITVGAMNTQGTLRRDDDIVTSYTSKGPTVIDHFAKPDLVAPGNRILSLKDAGSYFDKVYPENRVPINTYSTDTGTSTPDYYQLSGTSMAAPIVSSAAALLIQKDPALTPDQVKARLMRTASKFPQISTVSFDPATGYQWTSQYDLFTIGAGYLDVNAALADSSKPVGLALSPAVTYDTATDEVSMIVDLRSIWGTNSGWAERSVWGSGSVVGTRSIWGNSAAWGWEGSSAFTSIWSERSMWGNRSIWGNDDIQGLSLVLNGDR